MQGARRVSQVYTISDYSYKNSRFTGDRWMLAGDAAGFIDPIFSTGVFLAILSGEQCADALHQILDAPGRKAAIFRNYEKRLNQVMNKYLRFVEAWYRPEFIEIFTTPSSASTSSAPSTPPSPATSATPSPCGGGWKFSTSSCSYSAT